MEDKELMQGSLGDVKLSLKGGLARIEAAGSVPGDSGATAGAFVQVDSQKLLDKLFAEIEAKSPAGFAGIEDGVKSLLKSAVAAI